jgi:Asp-tRNA(Asn)/Glu-tRNA(Gln) amidotransferase A subunit family amidase
MTDPADLTALQARDLIARGELAPLELVEACLARIAEREPEIGAWTFLNPEVAHRQAEKADEERRSGRPLGALHGVPVGVKDIIDTADMPTENGTVLHAGRRPREDASIVGFLRAWTKAQYVGQVNREVVEQIARDLRRDLSGLPGVVVRAGVLHEDRFPSCGCDGAGCT